MALLVKAIKPALNSYLWRRPIISITRAHITSKQHLPFFSRFFTNNNIVSSNMSTNINKSDEEWRAILTPEQFRVLRQKGTERPGTGKYEKYKGKGVYECAACGTPLYTSDTKFDSGCGWPAFFDAIPGAVTRHVDSSFGMERIEITCTACGGHLGHVFKGEGFNTPTDERHCVNSVSMNFKNDEGKEQ